MTETTATTIPYPTIEDKVALFEAHGIDVRSHFGSDRVKPNTLSQLVVFDGPDAAGAAAKIAKEHGIRIHQMCMFWPYSDANKYDGECRSGLAFL